MKPQQSANPVVAARSELRVRWIIVLMLAIACLGIFGQTLRNGFLNFDDNDYVYANPVVSQGLTWAGVKWAFSAHAFNWHPLTWLTHMADCQWYGLHPWGHHLTSVLIHTATVVLLFWLLSGWTADTWRSALVAALFGLHPLRVESVAWIAERKDVLSGLFFVLTLMAYGNWVKKGRGWRYGLILLCYALGLMSKPMLVTLPVVLILVDYWPLQRTTPIRRRLIEKIPFILMAAASCAVTYWAQTAVISQTASIPLLIRLVNAVSAVGSYVGQTVCPINLAVYYPYSAQVEWRVLNWGGLMWFAILGWAAVRWRKTQPAFGVGWLWFLVMLLPVLGLVQVGRQSHADRYTYLPHIGLFIVMVWVVWRRWTKWLVLLAVLIVVVFSAVTVRQISFWRTSETMWHRALAVTEQNDLAHYALGNDLFDRGQLDEALVEYRASLAIRQSYPEAHYNYGTALYQKGDLQGAESELAESIHLQPANPQAQNNLGSVLSDEDKLKESIEHFQEALRLEPEFASAHLNLGIALFRQGNLESAISNFNDALRLKTNYPAAHYNLAGALYNEGRMAEAISQYDLALQLTPADSDTLNNLAWILATAPDNALRNGTRALTLARHAVELTHAARPGPWRTLAAANAEVGDFDEAIQAATRAVELEEAAGDQRWAEVVRHELAGYREHKPVRAR